MEISSTGREIWVRSMGRSYFLVVLDRTGDGGEVVVSS